MKIRNKITGEIVEVPDQPYTTESQATISERFRAGLAPEKTRIKEWENMLGAGNVRQTPDGEIEIRKGGKWGPVEGPSNWSLTELAGDVADYGGELIEDIGAGVGAALGAAKGTAVLPGVGTVAGLSAGGGVGRAIGSGARQMAAGALGVKGFEGERIGEIGSSALEGAIVEPIGFGVGKAVAQGAKAAAPYVKKAVEEPMRFATKYIAGTLSAKNPKLVEKLLVEEGPELLDKFKQGSQGFEKTVNRSTSLGNDMYKAANQRYSEALEGGIDMQAPASNAPIFNVLQQVRERLDVVPDETGAIPLLTGLDEASDVKYIGTELPKLIAEVNSPRKAMTLKKQIGNKLKSRQYWTKPRQDRTDFEDALAQIYNATDDVIEQSAIAQGKGDQYVAAKQAYKERIEVAERLNNFFGNRDKAASTIRQLENAPKQMLLSDISGAVELEPDLLAPVLKDMLLASRASNLDRSIGAMEMGRVGQGVFEDIKNVPGKAAAFLLSRPETMAPIAVKAGQGIRAVGDIAESATKGLMTPIGEQVSREATRALSPIGERTGLSPNEIESEIQSRAPELVDYARNRYGANFKRATDAGADDVTAAFTVIRDQLGKGNTKVVEAFGDLQERSGTDGKRFADTTYTILQRYTGAQ